METVIAGAYDYIEYCRIEYGDEYVDSLLDRGYEPILVQGVGWRWIKNG